MGSRIKEGKGGCSDHSGSAGNLGTQRTGGVSMEGVPDVEDLCFSATPWCDFCSQSKQTILKPEEGLMGATVKHPYRLGHREDKLHIKMESHLEHCNE